MKFFSKLTAYFNGSHAHHIWFFVNTVFFLCVLGLLIVFVVRFESLKSDNQALQDSVVNLSNNLSEVSEEYRKDKVSLIKDLNKIDRSISDLHTRFDEAVQDVNGGSLTIMMSGEQVASVSTERTQPTTPFGGIGLTFKSGPIVGALEINSVLKGRPADKAGIKPLDKIVKIDDMPVAGMAKTDALEKMRGPVGTTVKLSYLAAREESDALKEVTLTRDLIKMTDQPTHQGLPDDLVWEVPDEDKHFILTSSNISEGKNVRVYTALNSGKKTIPPRSLRVTDIAGGKKDVWQVLPESTCITKPVPPDQKCTVIVKVDPVMDGQMNAVISISGQREFPTDPENLVLTGYTKGVAGKLPDNVIGNGDPCPVAGEKAEVAVSATSGFRANDGYYELSHAGGFKLFTATCDQWQAKTDGTLFCNNPGSGYHTATMKEYISQTIEGPWDQVRVEDRHVTARLTCREGALDQVDWTW